MPATGDRRPRTTDSAPPATWTRRRFLAAGAAGATALVVGCSDDGDDPAESTTTRASSDGPEPTVTEGGSGATSTAGGAGGGEASETGTPADTVFTAADFASLGTCVVLPELMAGPFPTVDQIERRDIAEGMAGHPLRVGIQVVDAACEPIPGARVEIWHCDVDGDYSAYADGATADDAGPGTTFFRGYQVANDEGIVELHTRFPGWYPGRAIHIHAAVRVDDTTVLTTQFLFDDAVNRRITAEEAYADHGPPDTTNAEDGVSGGDPGGDGLLMTVLDDAAIGGSRALIVVGVDPAGA